MKEDPGGLDQLGTGGFLKQVGLAGGPDGELESVGKED